MPKADIAATTDVRIDAAMTLKVNLKPASTAVPAAAAKQQNDKYNDEKRGGIHVRRPLLRMFGMLQRPRIHFRLGN